MRLKGILSILVLALRLGINQAIACETDPLGSTLDTLSTIRPLSELYSNCSNPNSEEDLCKCEPIVSEVNQTESEALMKAESEKAWMDAFQGEIWGLGQSLINFDSATRSAKKSSTQVLAPTCSISSIFQKIASFAETEGCDGTVFKERVKAIFKTESLSEAQENIVRQVTSISNNKAPSSIKNSANICIPYTTFTFMKKGSSTFDDNNVKEDMARAKKDIKSRCESLVSDKVKPFFCSKNLPNVDFNSFQRVVRPSIENSQGATKATDLAFKHYCSESKNSNKTTEQIEAEQAFSSAISLEEREITDFEKFNSGIKTEYEEFNKSVCSLLPKCTNDETKGECRNVISLRAMLIDNIKKKANGEGAEKFLSLFSRSPEKTQYDSSILGSLTQEEFDSSSKLLTYLNEFIINKADTLKNSDGTSFSKSKLVNSKSQVKNKLDSVSIETKPKLTEDQKALKKINLDLLFEKLQKRGDESLSFSSKDLDKIENPELLKDFVSGGIVRDPNLESSPPSQAPPAVPAAREEASTASTTPAPSTTLNNNSVADVNRTRSENFNRTQNKRESTASKTSPSSEGEISSYRAPTNSYSRPKSGDTFKTVNSKSETRSRSSKTSDTNQLSSSKQEFPTSTRPSNSRSNSFDRFEKAYNNYAPTSEARSPASGGGKEGQSPTSAPESSEEYKDIQTGKKGKGQGQGTSGKTASAKGASTTGSGSGEADPKAGQAFILGKDGKPLKGIVKTPAYMFDKIIPHVVIEKMGITNVVLKYGLVGKRFNTLEVDQENNFILHTFDFSTEALAFEDSFNNNQYNIVRIDILKQINEIKKTDNDAGATLKMLAGKTKNVKSDKIKYEITKEEIISKTIPPSEVESVLASNN